MNVVQRQINEDIDRFFIKHDDVNYLETSFENNQDAKDYFQIVIDILIDDVRNAIFTPEFYDVEIEKSIGNENYQIILFASYDIIYLCFITTYLMDNDEYWEYKCMVLLSDIDHTFCISGSVLRHGNEPFNKYVLYESIEMTENYEREYYEIHIGYESGYESGYEAENEIEDSNI